MHKYPNIMTVHVFYTIIKTNMKLQDLRNTSNKSTSYLAHIYNKNDPAS